MYSLVDTNSPGLSIDTIALPAAAPSFFWSSTPYTTYTAGYYGWYVEFSYGQVSRASADSASFVRLVR